MNLSQRLGALLVSGDFRAIARRVEARLTGRPPPLPEDLVPKRRPVGERTRATAGAAPHIMMISPPLALNGAPLSQFEIAAGLATRGWNVQTWCAAPGPAAALYEKAGLPLGFSSALDVPQTAPALYENGVSRMAEFIRSKTPDLIYANTIDLFPAVDAARCAGVDSVWNIRESEPWRNRLADRHIDVAARALACFEYPRTVVFVAEVARKAWTSFVPPGAATVIYNAPQPADVPPPEERRRIRESLGALPDETLLISIGTVCARKGQIDIAKALALVPEDVLKRLRIAFVGAAEPAYLARLTRAIPARARERVIFTGPLEAGSKVISASDALVNTSRSEAFPRTILEAAAAGTPIIAAAAGGVGERLADRESALFYEPGDSARLAGLFVEAANDAGLLRSLAAGANNALVTGWTFDDMIAAYDARFHRAMSLQAPRQ